MQHHHWMEHKPIQNGFLVGAEKNGWKVLSVTSGGDAQKQINDVNDFITQGVKAMLQYQMTALEYAWLFRQLKKLEYLFIQ